MVYCSYFTITLGIHTTSSTSCTAGNNSWEMDASSNSSDMTLHDDAFPDDIISVQDSDEQHSYEYSDGTSVVNTILIQFYYCTCLLSKVTQSSF
jgi:hypothetical protein